MSELHETERVEAWKSQGVPEQLLRRGAPGEPTVLELIGDVFDLGGFRQLTSGDEGLVHLVFDEGRGTWSIITSRLLRVEGPFGAVAGDVAFRAATEDWGPLEDVEDDEGGGRCFYFEHGEAHLNADGTLRDFAHYHELEDGTQDGARPIADD